MAVGFTAAWAPLALAGEGPGEPRDQPLEQGVEGPVRAVLAQPVEQDPDQPIGEVDEPGATPAPQQAPEGPEIGDPGDPPNEVEREQSGGYFLVSPGLVQVPLDTRDVGYQWGLGIGYTVRTDTRFAIGVGLNFEHGINDLGDVPADRKPADHQYRVQGELMPGLEFLDSRLFLYLNFGLGYAGWLQRWTPTDEVQSNTLHGIAFSPGIGLSGRVWRTFTLGAQIGADLQWMRLTRSPFDAHNIDAKIMLGWMF